MRAPKTNYLTYLNYLPRVVEMMLINGAKSATKYVDRRTVVRAHRVTYGGKLEALTQTLDIRVKIGKPNYHERKFIADCVVTDEPFPVRKVQLAYFRKRK